MCIEMQSPFENSTDSESYNEIIEKFFRDLHDKQRTFKSVVLVSLYVPTFILSLSGNTLVIYVVASKRKMRSVTNYLLLNLALADLLISVICVPSAISSHLYKPWIYGEFLCKFIAYMQGVSVTASVSTLTLMSIHRFNTLKNGHRSKFLTKKLHLFLVLLAVWTGSCLFLIPVLYVRQLDFIRVHSTLGPAMCLEIWPDDRYKVWFGIICLFVIYIIPAVIISVCYVTMGRALYRKGASYVSRTNVTYVTRKTSIFRRGAAKVLILVVVLFLICWLPYNITSLVSDIAETHTSTEVLPFVLWLAHAHSAANPFMYWCLNRRLRRELSNTMKCSSD